MLLVTPSWKSFSTFLSDIYTVDNFDKVYTDGWHIDKDILKKGNKNYSKDTVCFVPKAINSLFTKSNAARGKHKIGVHFNKRQGVFTASVRDVDKAIYLGVFKTEDEAFLAYKMKKEERIKEVANNWIGLISDNVYESMINYEVEGND